MKKGFTLLEILVAVGIISIMAGLGALSFSSAQKKARDAKRKSDLKTIQNAMEQYYSTCGYKYPTDISTNIVCPSPSVAILTSIPVDPKTTTPYPTQALTETNYQVCTDLETNSTQFCVYNQQ